MRASGLFAPGWWKYALAGVAAGILFHLFCGRSLAPVSGAPKYPEYDKWWGQCANTNSFEGLGSGDVYVREFVTTNLVLGPSEVRREVVTNRTEAVLL